MDVVRPGCHSPHCQTHAKNPAKPAFCTRATYYVCTKEALERTARVLESETRTAEMIGQVAPFNYHNLTCQLDFYILHSFGLLQA